MRTRPTSRVDTSGTSGRRRISRRRSSTFNPRSDDEPTYAAAYDGLADSWIALGWYGYVSPKEAFPHADEAARKALASTTRWRRLTRHWRWCASITIGTGLRPSEAFSGPSSSIRITRTRIIGMRTTSPRSAVMNRPSRSRSVLVGSIRCRPSSTRGLDGVTISRVSTTLRSSSIADVGTRPQLSRRRTSCWDRPTSSKDARRRLLRNCSKPSISRAAVLFMSRRWRTLWPALEGGPTLSGNCAGWWSVHTASTYHLSRSRSCRQAWAVRAGGHRMAGKRDRWALRRDGVDQRRSTFRPFPTRFEIPGHRQRLRFP